VHWRFGVQNLGIELEDRVADGRVGRLKDMTII